MNFNTLESTEETPEDPATDLNEALSESDPSFVAAPKPSVNRGTIGLFGLLAALAGATYFMYLRNGPQSASAAPPESAAADSAVTEFLSGGGDNVRMMQQTLAETQQVVAQFATYPGKAQVPLTALHTNPFRQAKSTSADSAADVNSRKRREEERAGILRAVEGLQLQSIIHSGARRTCMINNTMYQEGGQLDGFTIEQISPQSVVVRNGMYRFELRMQK